MEEKKTVFDYISNLFASFGVITFIFMIMDLLIGDAATGYSPFFEYGKRALSINTLFQILALAVIISICRNLLLTDRWIRQMSMFVRNCLFFLSLTVTTVLFVLIFKWFPLSDIAAWIGFIISFTLCSALAVVISRLREKADNRIMDQALERYKKSGDPST